MTVYVDWMQADFGRMKMSHLVSDTSDELFAMVDRIGVDRRWIQDEGTYREHFDVCQAKRKLAIENGAVPCTLRQLGVFLREKRLRGASPHQERASE